MSDWLKDEIVGRAPWEADPVVPRETMPRYGPPRKPLIVLGDGRAVPDLLAPSKNPNSAGRYPLARRYSVGDGARFTVTNPGSGDGPTSIRLRVTKVDEAQDRVEINDGRIVWDLMGNTTETVRVQFDLPKQSTPAEFYVGRKWTAAFQATAVAPGNAERAGRVRAFSIGLAIVARERVQVPAGTFDAFRIQGYGSSGPLNIEETTWLVPWLNFPVKMERLHYVLDRGFGRRQLRSERHELVSARQFAIHREADR